MTMRSQNEIYQGSRNTMNWRARRHFPCSISWNLESRQLSSQKRCRAYFDLHQSWRHVAAFAYLISIRWRKMCERQWAARPLANITIKRTSSLYISFHRDDFATYDEEKARQLKVLITINTYFSQRNKEVSEHTALFRISRHHTATVVAAARAPFCWPRYMAIIDIRYYETCLCQNDYIDGRLILWLMP